MPTLMEYECPACGGGLQFDSGLQKVKCPYCETEFDVESFAQKDADLAQDLPQAESACLWQEDENVFTYICQSCGGEILCDANTAATSCPYCDSPVVMKERLAGSLRPDLVIPFKLDKEAAKAALRNHYKGKVLLPKAFKDENHINEIKGIYVPFWLYDTEAHANVRYKASRTRSWSDSRYIYTETSFFAVRLGGWMGFERVPVDGSSKMEDALMESIEPFDCSQAVPFHTAYLSGYLADKYDVDSDTSIQRANERIKRSAEEVLRDTVVGYTTVVPEASSVSFQNGSARYALYPVWLLNTTWNGQKYTFAMNGQTGKMAGDLPMDKGAFKRWFFGLLAGVGAAVFALQYLLWL